MNLAFILKSFGVEITQEQIAAAQDTFQRLPTIVADVLKRFDEMERRNLHMHAMITELHAEQCGLGGRLESVWLQQVAAAFAMGDYNVDGLMTTEELTNAGRNQDQSGGSATGDGGERGNLVGSHH